MEILLSIVAIWLGFSFLPHIFKAKKILKILNGINEMAINSPELLKDDFDLYCRLKNEKPNKDNVVDLIHHYVLSYLESLGYELKNFIPGHNEVTTYFFTTKITIYEALNV